MKLLIKKEMQILILLLFFLKFSSVEQIILVEGKNYKNYSLFLLVSSTVKIISSETDASTVRMSPVNTHLRSWCEILFTVDGAIYILVSKLPVYCVVFHWSLFYESFKFVAVCLRFDPCDGRRLWPILRSIKQTLNVTWHTKHLTLHL